MLASFIYAGAERHPERPAVVADGRRLTYGEFARAIEAVIQALERQVAAGPGYAVVAIADLLEHWVVALALRELGLTTAPVMSAENAAGLRLEAIRCVVCGSGEAWPGLEALCQANQWSLLRVKWAGALARPMEAGRPRSPKPGDHVLQTSATTGAYKKVLMARSFERRFFDQRRLRHRLDADSRYALFNFGAWTGAGYKTAGAVWMAGGEVALQQFSERWRMLAEARFTHAAMVPSYLADVLAAPVGALVRQPEMILHLGGATPRETLLAQARSRITEELYNAMSSTEAETFAYTRLATADDRRWHQLVPERTPQLVDEAGRPVPRGEVGELRVSTRDGPQGYLDDPEATAAFFRDGCFHTGDLGRLRDDGRMELLGRVTDVINVMGHKISPAPFEEELCERLGVSGACLFVRPDATGEDELQLMLEAPEPPVGPRLADALRQVLTGFAQVRVHFTAALPRNANGKVLRADVLRRVGLVAAP